VKAAPWVFVGGMVGGSGRYLMGRAGPVDQVGLMPWDTLAVNLTGCALIGLVAVLTARQGRWPLDYGTRAGLMAGVMGGLTTVSFFNWQILRLLQEGHAGVAAAYLLASVLGGLAAAWGGARLGRRLNARVGPG
jgi:fluoride exporter